MYDIENDEIILEEDCEKILRKYSKGKEWKVKSYIIDSLSDKIEGLLGEHFIINIEYEEKGEIFKQRFFMKILNGKSQVIAEMTENLNAYWKEEFFYQHLLNEFANENIDVSFAPDCYLCKPYAIVLEDLSLRKFTMTAKKDFFDLEHCQIALKALAKFHSSSIIYERNKSISLLEKFPEQFEEKVFAKNENCAAKWFKCSVQGLIELITHLNIPQQTKPEFAKRLEELYNNLHNIIKPSDKYPCTILHGDLWTNNFLFQYENNKPINSVLIDYQLLKFGTPACDVVQMILTDTRKKLRNEHYNELLHFYYENFTNYLSQHDITGIISKKDFLKSCEELLPAVKLQAIADRSITFLSDETYEHVLVDDETFRKFLFEDRNKFIIDSYLKNESFRELMDEDMLELNELLLRK